jgi:hypothetical protein
MTYWKYGPHRSKFASSGLLNKTNIATFAAGAADKQMRAIKLD